MNTAANKILAGPNLGIQIVHGRATLPNALFLHSQQDCQAFGWTAPCTCALLQPVVMHRSPCIMSVHDKTDRGAVTGQAGQASKV